MSKREHAGGAPNTAYADGEVHPVVEFDYAAIDGHGGEPLYTVEDLSGAMREVFLWVVHDGRFRAEGVYSRAMVAAWLISPDGVKAENQSQLARKLGVSESRTARIVKSFCRRFNFVATRSGYRPRQTVAQRRARRGGK
jgi:hypothetical protein